MKKQDRKSVKQLFKQYLSPYSKLVTTLVVINIVTGFLFSLRPLAIAPGLTIFTGGKNIAATGLSDLTLNNIGPTLIASFGLNKNDLIEVSLFIGGAYLLITLIIAILSQIGQIILIRTRSAISRDILVQLHRHLLHLPLAFFNKSRAGVLVSRMTNDVSIIANSLDEIIRGVLQSLAQIIVTLIILLRTDAQFAIIVLSLGGVHMLITVTLAEKFHKSTAKAFDKLGDLYSAMVETISGIRVIKSFAAERWESRRIEAVAESTRQRLIEYRTTIYLETPIRMFADALLVGVVLLMTFYAIQENRMNLAAAAMFFYLSRQMIEPVSILFSKVLSISSLSGGAAGIVKLFNRKNELSDGVKNVNGLQDSISLQHVNFSYENNLHVLKDITFEINKGEMVAIVGPSGAGKSTIADLILHLYDVTQGVITYDGVDVREIQQRDYRRQFGVVAQDCLLFNGSIRDNIVYNRKYDPVMIEYAINTANAAEFIQKMTRGINTHIGDRGVLLSGGQRQRIAIARAVYNKPAILVLDEATSSLDSDSEKSVQVAIDNIAKEMTVIVIAHRLSTVLHADKIIVLNGGSVEAVGVHDDLLIKSKTYSRLCGLQSLGTETQPITN